MDSVRIDKWLWSVRIFKTRSQASDACRSGNVKVDEQSVKPSREIKPDDTIEVHKDHINRVLRVKALLKSRVGAKLVEQYMEDLTPQEEYDKLKQMHEVNHEKRPRGIGRPTKKERRLIERLKKSKF